MKRNLRATGVAATMTLVLALSACGSDDNNNGSTPDPDSTSSAPPAEIEPAQITLWLAGTDTDEELRNYLTSTFADENPGSTLDIQTVEWGDLLTQLNNNLSSPENTPDVVEVGNTQSPTYTNILAFRDISHLYSELGGDHLLEGFVEVGKFEDKNYTLPYYAGSRFVFYNTELWGDTPIPTTLSEFGDAVISLKTDSTGGFNVGGSDWRGGIAWIFAYGGEIAVQDDAGNWTSALSSPEAIEGLTEWQRVYQGASNRATTDTDADYFQHLNAGEAASMLGPNWSGCCMDDIDWSVFPLPSVDGSGVAPVFAGGSNIGISAASQHPELAENLLRIIFSEEYQTLLASKGMGPGNTEYTDLLGDTDAANASKVAQINAKLTPAAKGWAVVESENILEVLFNEIAEGGDIATATAKADAAIDAIING